MMDEREVPPGTGFAWEEAQRKLDLQIDHAESLDSKATTLLGFIAVALGVVATSLEKFRSWGRPVAAGAVLGLGISAFLVLRAFWVRRYDRSPSPEEVWDYALRDRSWIQHRLLTTRWAALNANSGILDRKARDLRWAMVTLGGVAGIALVAAIVRLI